MIFNITYLYLTGKTDRLKMIIKHGGSDYFNQQTKGR